MHGPHEGRRRRAEPRPVDRAARRARARASVVVRSSSAAATAAEAEVLLQTRQTKASGVSSNEKRVSAQLATLTLATKSSI